MPPLMVQQVDPLHQEVAWTELAWTEVQVLTEVLDLTLQVYLNFSVFFL